jgi:hypothetical protein
LGDANVAGTATGGLLLGTAVGVLVFKLAAIRCCKNMSVAEGETGLVPNALADTEERAKGELTCAEAGEGGMVTSDAVADGGGATGVSGCVCNGNVGEGNAGEGLLLLNGGVLLGLRD